MAILHRLLLLTTKFLPPLERSLIKEGPPLSAGDFIFKGGLLPASNTPSIEEKIHTSCNCRPSPAVNSPKQ